MDAGRHNVAGRQAFLHHMGVMRVRAAAVQPMQFPDTLVCRQHNAAAAAGIIRNAKVAESIRVEPVQLLRYRQVRQQNGGFRSSVIGFESLAVSDESLEHGAGNVVVANGFRYSLGGLRQSIQHIKGDERRNAEQQFSGDMKNRGSVSF